MSNTDGYKRVTCDTLAMKLKAFQQSIVIATHCQQTSDFVRCMTGKPSSQCTSQFQCNFSLNGGGA